MYPANCRATSMVEPATRTTNLPLRKSIPLSPNVGVIHKRLSSPNSRSPVPKTVGFSGSIPLSVAHERKTPVASSTEEPGNMNTKTSDLAEVHLNADRISQRLGFRLSVHLGAAFATEFSIFEQTDELSCAAVGKGQSKRTSDAVMIALCTFIRELGLAA
jgi:hypothetical protein